MNRATLLNRFILSLQSNYEPLSLLRAKQITLNSTNLRKAAVLVPLVERADGLNVILTQRAFHLRHHPGQISFPGGSYESADRNLKATALRETYEEIGIVDTDISIFGSLPSLPTVSGFEIYPYLAFVSKEYSYKIDTDEVSSIFEVPINHFFHSKYFLPLTIHSNNHIHITYGTCYKEYLIWGATAQILNFIKSQVIQ